MYYIYAQPKNGAIGNPFYIGRDGDNPAFTSDGWSCLERAEEAMAEYEELLGEYWRLRIVERHSSPDDLQTAMSHIYL